MRKQIQILLILMMVSQSAFYINAQSKNSIYDKRFFVDFGVEQNFMLTKWYKQKAYNQSVRSVGSTDIYARANLRVYKDWGVWLSHAFCIQPARTNTENIPWLTNNLGLDISDYYISNQYGYQNNDNSDFISGFKFSGGLYYKFKLKKLNSALSLGLGANYYETNGGFSYKLKQKNSNEAYIVKYKAAKNIEYTGGYINIQLRTSYNISRRWALLFGLNFNQYLNRNSSSIQVTDYYDGTLISETKKKSRLVNTLGISVGVGL